MILHQLTVILLLISSLSGFPLTNVTEQQLVDESNKKPLLLNSSISVTNNDTLHIQTNTSEHLTANTYDGPVLPNNIEHVKSDMRTMSSSTPDPWYTTTGPDYPTTDTPWDTTTGSYYPSNGTPWYVFVIVAFVVVFCCCACIGACTTKGGHWEHARVWVED